MAGMEIVDPDDPVVQRYLRTMPLHAVTEVYGEAGLRLRFTLELQRLPAADRDLVARAMEAAAEAHHGQRRVREPYLNHLLRVALRLLCYYEVTDAEVVTAALLHDAVEDQAHRLAGPSGAGLDEAGRREVAFAAVAAAFGPRVARLVAAVTNPLYDAD